MPWAIWVTWPPARATTPPPASTTSRPWTSVTQLGDPSGQASALNNLGSVARSQGDYAAARQYYQQALDIRTQLGEPSGPGQRLEQPGQRGLRARATMPPPASTSSRPWTSSPQSVTLVAKPRLEQPGQRGPQPGRLRRRPPVLPAGPGHLHPARRPQRPGQRLEQPGQHGLRARATTPPPASTTSRPWTSSPSSATPAAEPAPWATWVTWPPTRATYAAARQYYQQALDLLIQARQP